MNTGIESKGKCFYCNELLESKELKTHLAKHLKELEKNAKDSETETFCHVEVQAEDMFLHLLVKGDTKMKTIDTFLKKIWLDCCGHMSGFSHRHFKISKSDLVEHIFEPKVKVQHQYDYGSTTHLDLIGHKHYQLKEKKELILLSRNEPLKLMCDICKKKIATTLCCVCLWDDESFFCDNCSEKHGENCSDYADYASMPIVNSPRMGVCGYEGGEIDLERDGIWKKSSQS